MKFGFLSFWLLFASAASAQESAVFLGPVEAPPAMRHTAERGIMQALARAEIEVKPTLQQCGNGDAACIARILRETSTEAAIFYTVFAPSETRAEGLVLIQFHDHLDNTAVGRVPFSAPTALPDAINAATLAALSAWQERTGGRGHIRVDGTPQSAVVLVDGAVRSNLPLDEDIAAGTYVIRVVTQGYEDFEETVEVTAGQTTSRSVHLVRQGETGDEQDPDPDPVITPPRPNERGSALPSYLLGGGLILAGAALLVPGFYALANDGECADTPCSGVDGRLRVKADFAGGDFAFLAVGALLAVAGAVLIAARPWRLSPAASQTAVGLDLRTRF